MIDCTGQKSADIDKAVLVFSVFIFIWNRGWKVEHEYGGGLVIVDYFKCSIKTQLAQLSHDIDCGCDITKADKFICNHADNFLLLEKIFWRMIFFLCIGMCRWHECCAHNANEQTGYILFYSHGLVCLCDTCMIINCAYPITRSNINQKYACAPKGMNFIFCSK